MKKILSIFLSVIFLASAMGVTINSHYCGVQLQSIRLTPKNCCCKKDTKMKDDCCKNEIKYLKITDNYFSASPNYFKKIDANPVVLSFYFIPVRAGNSSFTIYNDHSPPRLEDRVIAFRSILI